MSTDDPRPGARYLAEPSTPRTRLRNRLLLLPMTITVIASVVVAGVYFLVQAAKSQVPAANGPLLVVAFLLIAGAIVYAAVRDLLSSSLATRSSVDAAAAER